MNPHHQSVISSVFGEHKGTPSVFSFLLDHFSEVEFKSHELIVEAGNVEKYFYLVLSGVQAIYLINAKGEKVILGFSYQGSPSGVFDSFITQKPSSLFLEALTDSAMLRLSKDQFDVVFERFPELYMWRTHFIEHILFGRLSRERELLTNTAKERFDLFMQRCPKELLQIPQKYLASYLHMQPETFSRLRAERD